MPILSDSDIAYLLICTHYAFAPAGKKAKEEVRCRVCTTPRQIVKPLARDR